MRVAYTICCAICLAQPGAAETLNTVAKAMAEQSLLTLTSTCKLGQAVPRAECAPPQDTLPMRLALRAAASVNAGAAPVFGQNTHFGQNRHLGKNRLFGRQ